MARVYASSHEAALEAQRIGALQVRVTILCAFAQLFDGYDIGAIGIAEAAQHGAGDAFEFRALIGVEQTVFRPVHIVRPGEDGGGLVAVTKVKKVIKSPHRIGAFVKIFQPHEHLPRGGESG